MHNAMRVREGTVTITGSPPHSRWSFCAQGYSILSQYQASVVLENSNMAQLASNRYLVVHSLPQEDHYDTDDASARELYTILVSESTVCAVQPPQRRQHCPSLVDGPA